MVIAAIQTEHLLLVPFQIYSVSLSFNLILDMQMWGPNMT